ncbi:NLR family CARD domain-containing protein 3-like isoform X2 [Myripristis murdjan]|uniref:NLR family CARD domain-containing protein 3-like isoform X2 n=1 Tax=Myripristis murdjan TaxID=586833 RepID=UPI001175DB47|nr:NLR family CARD domain-containing protein 3-like isoform X2 [Myripristis murdjan]
MISHCQKMDGHAIFKLVQGQGINILLSELRRYKRILFPHLRESSQNKDEDADILAAEDDSARDGALKITLHVLKEMGLCELANRLESQIYGELDVCQHKLKHKLKTQNYICEGIAEQGKRTPLSKVYTELYITEGNSGTIINEHEVRQIEKTTRKPVLQDKPIKCEDIFNPIPGQDEGIRTVLTKGIAGIGKTVSVQKFNLDWAERRVNQDIDLLVNLPFRELNLIAGRNYTLIQLVHHFLAEAKEAGILDFSKYKLVFIFDGLDECQLPLNFDHNQTCRSVSQPAPVDVLLTNLIMDNLLPSAHIWITSRPAAAQRIPARFVNRVTEIRGFGDPQKEEYFRRKITDQNMADEVISHIKKSKSLNIMCYIPVFSWISASVLESILDEREKKKEGGKGDIPQTLTEMYTQFLVLNTSMKKRKYSAGEDAAETESQVKTDEETILKLGRLAFEHLKKGNMIFYEEDLRECNINVTDAAVHSGLFTQIFKNDVGLHQTRVYSFVHLSVQEFLAALYVFHAFMCCHQNLLGPQEATAVKPETRELSILHKSAVDMAVQNENGDLDLFLRFLLGLSQTSNQSLLQSVLTTVGSSSQSNTETVEYIKEKTRHRLPPERCINLFHCLSELNDKSLLDEIQTYLSSGSLSETKLSDSQWFALVFALLTSEAELDVFDLRKYSRSEEGLLRLLPVIKESRVALLKECSLTGECCKALASTLSSNTCLRELDLSDNDLQDSGVQLLCDGLSKPTCQLEKLPFCGITEGGCKFLDSALRSNPSHLKELDLSYNHPGESGVELLTALQNDLPQLTVSLTGNAEWFLKSALKKYACELTLDKNTAHSQLSFSEDNKEMTRTETAQPFPDNPERFTDWGQVLCKEGLTGRAYWEAEWTGEWTGIGVAYKGISRKAKGNDSVLGCNDKSWSLRFCNGKYTAWYNKNDEAISVPYFITKRVGVYLDWPAGTLSFYAVSSNSMTHLHTLHAKFTEPLYPGFRLGFADTSLSLCQVEYPPNATA